MRTSTGRMECEDNSEPAQLQVSALNTRQKSNMQSPVLEISDAYLGAASDSAIPYVGAASKEADTDPRRELPISPDFQAYGEKNASMSVLSGEKDSKSDDPKLVQEFIYQQMQIMRFLSVFTAMSPGDLLATMDLSYSRQKLNDLRAVLIRNNLLTDELMLWMCNHQKNQLSFLIVRLIETDNFYVVKRFCEIYNYLLANVGALKNYSLLASKLKDSDLARQIATQGIDNPFDALIIVLDALIRLNLPSGCPELEEAPARSLSDVPRDFLQAIWNYSRCLLIQLFGEPEYDSAVSFVKNQVCFSVFKLIEEGFLYMHISSSEDIMSIIKLVENDALASAAFILQKIAAAKVIMRQRGESDRQQRET